MHQQKVRQKPQQVNTSVCNGHHNPSIQNREHNKVQLKGKGGHGYPDNAVWVSSDDDVLRVPFVHLRHTAAQDLLAAPCEGVGAGDGAAVNAPHVNVCASTGHDIALHKHKHVVCPRISWTAFMNQDVNDPRIT